MITLSSLRLYVWDAREQCVNRELFYLFIYLFILQNLFTPSHARPGIWLSCEKNAQKHSKLFTSGGCFVKGGEAILNQSRFMSKTLQDMAIVTMEDEWEPSRYIEWRHFHWPWMTPHPDFKDTPIVDVEYLRNGTRQRHSYDGMLIWTYTRPTQQCNFRMTLSDCVTAIFSTTKNIAQPLRDSWASC